MLTMQSHSLACSNTTLFGDAFILMFLSFFTRMIPASWFSEKSAAGFDLSGVIASEANFSKGDFKEVVMSKSYARVSKGNRLILPGIYYGCFIQSCIYQVPVI